jgi:hypothetical protein
MRDGQISSLKHADNCIGNRYVGSAGRVSAPAGRSSGSSRNMWMSKRMNWRRREHGAVLARII